MPERASSIYILFLLFLINLMNFFDRTIPAVVLEPIRKEFGLDDTALGLLGASFTLIYAVAGVAEAVPLALALRKRLG
jgi:sugar phosphate permease